MKTVIGIVALVVVVAGLYFLNEQTRREDGQSLLHVAPQVEVPVEAVRPERREITRTVQAPGDVEAIDEVDISSEVVAKIVEMPVEEGEYVEKGALLCRLDDTDYRARVVSAEANIAKLQALRVQAEADLQFAERNHEEAQRLFEAGAMTIVDFRNMQTSLVKARALVEMREKELIEAAALLESAQQDLAKTVITAPLAGVVSQRFADPGEVVITGTMNNPGTRIMVVTDLSRMQVRCRVDEGDAPLVAAGQPAQIYLQADSRISVAGEVLRVGTKGVKPLGRDVVTFETLVLITVGDTRVMPGMTANVEIEVARRPDALTIPVEAVVFRKRRDLPAALVEQHDARQRALGTHEARGRAEYVKLVFCIEDGKAQPHLVETGINDIASVELLDGVVADAVVVTGPYRSLDQLEAGAAVKLLEAEKPAPAGGGADPALAAGPAAEDGAPADGARGAAPTSQAAASGERAGTASDGAAAEGLSGDAAADGEDADGATTAAARAPRPSAREGGAE